jgi:hypothetical protein
VDFREFSEDRSIQRPSIESDDLVPTTTGLKGEFAFEERHLSEGEFVGTTGEGRLVRSVLEDVNLSETVVEPLALADVRISGCVLSNARWERVEARRIEIVKSQLVGWQVGFELAHDVAKLVYVVGG